MSGKSLRAFTDGLVSVVLPVYLIRLGYSAFGVGAIVTSTLLGSALLTLAIGLFAHHFPGRRILLAACALMAATGLSFAVATAFWPLLIVAFLGTINPSAGDVSIFLPAEQSLLAGTVPSKGRTALFARYSLIGSLAGAFGTLAAAFPDMLAGRFGMDEMGLLRGVFVFYAAIGCATWFIYRPLSSLGAIAAPSDRKPLGRSRHIVLVMAGLFSLDAFGGGFVVQSLLALWLFKAFHVSVATASSILFWAGICSAVSYLVAVPLSRRFGLINTMVFTHLPSNVLLIFVPFAPNLTIAIALLLVRSALSQMDVPTRTSYVMAVVAPEERPAAASITAVPRSLASAVSPLLAGYLLSLSVFGWPLIFAGTLKAVYDLLLLIRFRNLPPPEDT
ncbi:MAG: MFS transporter [Alphaproteobacteria bacterium]|nr:MFS transporter [Alphaproteobacteria bacterium]